MPTPHPTELVLHRASRTLEIAFDDGSRFVLPAEYLRAESPSAEVQGHGPGQKVLVSGKRNVGIRAVEPVGHYGVLLHFDDGHHTGIYSWQTLHALGSEQETRFGAYLQAIDQAGLGRD
jgi:DUF971 family protein